MKRSKVRAARPHKKEAPSQEAVSHLKTIIGNRIRDWRGDVSQEAIEVMSGVDRGIIGSIERASKDYRIDSLLGVIIALRADEKIIFDADPLTAKLFEELLFVLRKGSSEDVQLVMLAIRNAMKAAQKAAGHPSPPPLRMA